MRQSLASTAENDRSPFKFGHSLQNTLLSGTPMLPFSMVRPRRLLPSQVRSSCIASPAFSSFNFELSTFNFPAVNPFSATLTGHRQRNENATTLSPAFATLTRHVTRNPFVCHSYKKHWRWGLATNLRCSRQPMHFPLFPQRVNIEHAASPTTPIGSCAYFALLCIPGGTCTSNSPGPPAPIFVPPLSRSRQTARNVRR